MGLFYYEIIAVDVQLYFNLGNRGLQNDVDLFLNFLPVDCISAYRKRIKVNEYQC